MYECVRVYMCVFSVKCVNVRFFIIISIQVVARDNGSPQLSDSATVKICITDINDIPPVFDPLTVQVSVKEGM